MCHSLYLRLTYHVCWRKHIPEIRILHHQTQLFQLRKVLLKSVFSPSLPNIVQCNPVKCVQLVSHFPVTKDVVREQIKRIVWDLPIQPSDSPDSRLRYRSLAAASLLSRSLRTSNQRLDRSAQSVPSSQSPLPSIGFWASCLLSEYCQHSRRMGILQD